MDGPGLQLDEGRAAALSPDVVAALEAVNRRFYQTQAAAFARSRGHYWPGWRRALAEIDPGPGEALDLGCGQGRFGALLAEVAPQLRYTGVDESAALLARADPQLGRLIQARLDPAQPLPPGRFDLIVAFGLLHHIAGGARRRALLAQAAQRLRPGGWLVISYWDLHRSHPRADRYAPPVAVGLDPADLEPGDRLLYWGKAREGLRYCHHSSEAELQVDLQALAPLSLRRRFVDDGKRRDLNRYCLLQAPTDGPLARAEAGADL